MSIQTKRAAGLPIAMVGVATAIYLLVVYGYPRLFPLIDAAHPDHFERNVAAALADGDVSKAARIAHRATQVRQTDPMAYTVYARVLMEKGNVDEGVEQLNKAVALQKEKDPPYRTTRKPYYFAPARLSLGAYYWEQSKPVNAVVNFELARAYAELTDGAYADYHQLLYQAYAQQQHWARALEFGQPSDLELNALDVRDLVAIAYVGEGNQDWPLVERAAERLSAHDDYAGDMHYLLGRIAFAQKEYDGAISHLEQAVLNGHINAAFLLGSALEQKGDLKQAAAAYLRTSRESVYRLFALAKALSLLAEPNENKKELHEQFEREMCGLYQPQERIEVEQYSRYAPLAVRTSEPHVASGGRFPLLVLWEDRKADENNMTDILLLDSNTDDHLLLAFGRRILQLQWVENRLNWVAVEHLQEGEEEIPGWIDTARDWFALREEHAARIEKDTDGNGYLNISKLTWFYSIPVPAKAGIGYLLAARINAKPGKGSLGLQGLDKEEYVLSDIAVLNEDTANVWSWQANYMPSQVQWDLVRVYLNVMPYAGGVDYDDVMLLELDEPKSHGQDARAAS